MKHEDFELVFQDPSLLRPHEETVEAHVEEIATSLARTNEVEVPLLVDRSSKVVLDGHHRRAASIRLGIPLVPCLLVDYLESDRVRVTSWREGETVTKRDVISAGLSGNIMRPKTSRHLTEPATRRAA